MYRSRIPPWLVLLTPAFVVLLLVVAVPLVLSFYSSFTAFQLTRPETITRWIGTFNYQKAITDWNFWAAFGRTLLLVTLALNLEMLLGLGLALSGFGLRASGESSNVSMHGTGVVSVSVCIAPSGNCSAGTPGAA